MFKIFSEADELIDGAKREEYGPMKKSFEAIAGIWNIILESKLNEQIQAEDVPLMMLGLKLCRESFKHKHDTLVDICGYVKCLGVLTNDKEIL